MSAMKPPRRRFQKRQKVQRSSLQRLGMRRFSSFACIMGLCVLLLWGCFHVNAFISSLSNHFTLAMSYLGFTLEDVVVEGRMRTPKEQILKTLDLKRGISLFSINLGEAKEKLENLSWIKAARMERRLPDTLFIRISEKEPIAIWQNQNKTYLIDCDGELVETKEASKYKELFLVTGHQAPRHVHQLITLLDKFPTIKTRVTTATHLRATRWDINLDGKIDIKLPEKEMEQALKYLMELETHHQLMEHEIVTIDMRLPGQLILRLTPESIQRKNHMGKDV